MMKVMGRKNISLSTSFKDRTNSVAKKIVTPILTWIIALFAVFSIAMILFLVLKSVIDLILL